MDVIIVKIWLNWRNWCVVFKQMVYNGRDVSIDMSVLCVDIMCCVLLIGYMYVVVYRPFSLTPSRNAASIYETQLIIVIHS